MALIALLSPRRSLRLNRSYSKDIVFNLTKRKRVRLHLWLIALIGVIVPRRLRADWRQEWEAELRYREMLLAEWDRLDWRNKLEMLRRSLAAFWDALWLQTERWEDEMFQDVRYGIRMLRKSPGFTFVAALTLALGIGANSAIFSVVNAVLLRSLPYRDPNRLVMASYSRSRLPNDFALASEFLEWRDQAKSFEQIAAYRFDTADLTGSGEPERLNACFASAGLFATVGVAPALGRAFTPEEDTAGGAQAVILSDGLWRRRFGGDQQVMGRTLTLGGQSRTVIGIMPPGFHLTGEADLWLPLALNAAEHLNRKQALRVKVIARLKPGMTPEAARAELSVILERQRQAFPKFYDRYGAIQAMVTGLSESLVGNIRLALLALFGAVLFVLLIACANVANLLLARSAARQKEMAIRAAVGAGRWRLVRQSLTESLLLSLVGGLAGLLLARWGVKLLVAFSPDWIERIDESRVDGRVFGFTCVVALVTSLLAGLLPALQASKADVNETLKTQSSRSPRGGRRTMPALMITELALSLVLLVGAGLVIKSFLRLLAVPKGFNPDGVLTLVLSPISSKYPPGSSQHFAYYLEALTRVQALPGVQSAGLASLTPLEGGYTRALLQIEGRSPFERGQEPVIDINLISPEYFHTMGIEMRAGRPFAAQDGAEAPKVVIINETIARRYFPNEDPIGHRLLMGQIPRTIVGVASDTRHLGLDKETPLETYQPYTQDQEWDRSLVLAARVASGQNNPASRASLANAMRNQMQAIEPNEPVNQVDPLEDRLSNSRAVAGRRFQTLLFGVFAGLALVIATVGIYGVVSYAVSQRSQEIGIRMALGAQAGDVLRMVIWRGMSLTLMGVALGVAAALALTRVMKNLLFEVSSTDPATFALIASLLVGVAFIASYIPARRATKVDPLIALRSE
jgi:putative ABC transport system permease protein